MTYEDLIKEDFRYIEIEYNNEVMKYNKEQITEPFWNFIMKLENVKIIEDGER